MTLRGRRKGGRDRGFVEVGVAAAGALLVLGAVVGNGVAATVLDMSDGQTWLPDDDGRVVQINPATGEPERRLVVGSEGSEVEVAQSDGHLIVTDPLTGEITSIDLAGLVASGSRGSDAETWVLIGGGQVVLAEPSPGTVRAVDPLTLTDLGTPYRTDDLAHAVIDDEGSVWVLTGEGDLAQLDFAPEAGEFVVSTERPVTGAGSSSRLVPHASGATVFAPDGGAIVQVGTGPEVAVNVPALEGEVAPAKRSDADLVPASATDAGLVFMLTDGQVLNVDVGSLGCTSPGAPAVLAERVYVPCLGAGRVIVLDADGGRAGDDIVVPGGGDPQLLVDEGRLFVHTADDDRIVLVQPDGSTQVVDIGGAEVPEHPVDQPAPPRPPASSPPQPPPAAPASAGQPPPPQQNAPPADRTQGPPAPQDNPTQGSQTGNDGRADQARNDDDGDARQEDRRNDGGGDGNDSGGSDDGGSDDGSDGDDGAGTEDPDGSDGTGDGEGTDDGSDAGDGTGDGDGTDDGDGTGDGDGTDDGDGTEEGDGDTEYLGPTNVQATADGDDLVQVTWTAAEADVQEHIVTSSDGSPAVTVAGDATSATLDVASCETSVTITVTAHLTDGDPASANTAVDLADCEPGEEPGPDPGPPTNVQATVDGADELRVSWTAPEAAPEEYIVTSSDGSPARTVAGNRSSTNLVIATCDATVTITVTAYFPGGEQESASATVAAPDCEPDPAPPTNVQASLQGDDEVRVTWTAPEAEVEEYIVTSSDGSPAQTVAGSRTNATLGIAACDATVTLTVTAHFVGGEQESASTTVTAPDCPPDPVQATAPTNVQAQSLGSGQVQVTWTAASSGADTYVVYPSIGGGTDAGTATSVTLNLSPGTYTFTVETQLEGTQATSGPSGSVTVADVPGAPGAVGGSATPGPSQVQVSASWGAANGNGSDVTGYRVSHSGPGGSAITVTGTSTTLTINCSGQSLCLDGGGVTVQVQAVNGVGTGPAVTGTINVPAADIPRNGDGVLVEGFTADEVTGDVHAWIDYVPNSTWANFGGTCTVTVGGSSWAVPCSTPTRVFDGFGRIYTEVNGSASITATGGGVNATSNASVHVGPRGWCDPNSGICYDPQSLPMDPDGNPDVEHIPAPWTPPEVPNPPVLAAGIGLLGMAGLVRALRRRAGLVQQVLAGTDPDLELADSLATGDPPR